MKHFFPVGYYLAMIRNKVLKYRIVAIQYHTNCSLSTANLMSVHFFNLKSKKAQILAK